MSSANGLFIKTFTRENWTRGQLAMYPTPIVDSINVKVLYSRL